MEEFEPLERAGELIGQLCRDVPEIHDCLLASVDGLLLSGTGGELAGPQSAALTSTLCALAAQAVAITDRGELVDAVIRGTLGHLMVFAVGRTAILAVTCGVDVTPAWVNLRTRPVVEALAAISESFIGFVPVDPTRS